MPRRTPYVFSPPVTAAQAVHNLIKLKNPEVQNLRDCSVQDINRIKFVEVGKDWLRRLVPNFPEQDLPPKGTNLTSIRFYMQEMRLTVLEIDRQGGLVQVRPVPDPVPAPQPQPQPQPQPIRADSRVRCQNIDLSHHHYGTHTGDNFNDCHNRSILSPDRIHMQDEIEMAPDQNEESVNDRESV